MRVFPLVFTLFSLFIQDALCNDPISQSTLDSQGLWPFVLASRPLWEFGVPSKGLCPTRTAPCYPDYAVDPVTKQQHPGAGLQVWPLANGGCRFPAADGKSAGGIRGQPFPNYYIAKRCNDAEVRIGYWLYYPKDGFIGSGHKHDWEYYMVVWKRDGNGNFFRDRHILSYHGDRTGTAWKDVKDTVNDDLSKASGGNHAKIYPGWSKHPNFDTKKTTVCDTLLQSTMVAYRSDDWWYFPQEADLIPADGNSEIGSAIDQIGRRGDWGAADGWPAARESEMCDYEPTAKSFLVKEDKHLTLEDLFPQGLPWEDNGAVNATFPLGAPGTEKRDQEAGRYYPRSCGIEDL